MPVSLRCLDIRFPRHFDVRDFLYWLRCACSSNRFNPSFGVPNVEFAT